MSSQQKHSEVMAENTNFATTARVVLILPSIRLQLNRYHILFIIIFGNIRSLFSIAVYRRHKISARSCTSYFLALSINTFLFVYFARLTRFLELGFESMKFTSKSLAFCKIQSVSCHSINILSKKKTSNIVCILLAVLCISAYVHVLKYFIIGSRLKACCACFATFY
jgi:hypothetical protein